MYVYNIMMSYFLLPKKNNIIKLNPQSVMLEMFSLKECLLSSSKSSIKEMTYMDSTHLIEREKHIETTETEVNHINNYVMNDIEIEKLMIKPKISYSLAYYLNDTLESLNNLDIQNEEMNNIKKNINTHEFLFTKVPDINIPVCKVVPKSYIFFIIIEIINVFNIFDLFSNKTVELISYSENSECVINSLNVFKDYNVKYKNINIIHQSLNEKDLITQKNDYNFDSQVCFSNFNNISSPKTEFFIFLFYEIEMYTNIHIYTQGLIKIVYNMLINQKENGISIIKIDHIFYKPVIDILFLLTSLYEKVYIIKPNSSDITTNERFIVCKNFDASLEMIEYYILNLKICISEKEKFIYSLIDHDLIPCYFLNKLEDLNITIIHQQIETLDQIIGIAKNKNKEDKLCVSKKNNIQKCILWCEKNKIPYNKLFDKSNTFL